MGAELNINQVKSAEIERMSPVLWAYIGDAVYELLARQQVLNQGLKRINNIHHDTVKLVNAVCQAQMAEDIISLLDEDEREVLRRGRNTKSTPPKNTDIGLYRKSTGLEALFGYLYLQGRTERIKELFTAGLIALQPDL